MVAREKVTLEYFKQFVEQPENAGRLFELINEEIDVLNVGDLLPGFKLAVQELFE